MEAACDRSRSGPGTAVPVVCPPRKRGPRAVAGPIRYNADMELRTTAARSILTEQRSGFLASPPHPFTHTLAPYTGCAFGATTCGMYCYAQYLPNWTYAGGGAHWGSAVVAKENAPDLLDAALRTMSPARRRSLRIFMSSSTDPYQPVEQR